MNFARAKFKDARELVSAPGFFGRLGGRGNLIREFHAWIGMRARTGNEGDEGRLGAAQARKGRCPLTLLKGFIP